ncbi:MAG: hypothetical protein QM759_12545 [Terricaulis sp.]
MSDTAWVLKGVDPAARQQAINEAARRGVSLADHLTDIVLQNALADQMRAGGAALLAETDAETDIRVPAEDASTAFAIRHRLKALEKRLSASVGSIDGTIHALDAALFDLTSRLGDVEALAGDSTHAFSQALQELQANLAALRIQFVEADDAARTNAETNQIAHLELADACGELDQHIDTVEVIARGAETAAASLAVQQEALRQAVASDLDSLAHQTSMRLGEGLDHVRAAADAAARHADAAAAHVVNELRAVREAIDARLEEQAAETKNRMHAAFVDAADRMAALADRVLAAEHTQTRATDLLRGEISNVEDASQSALAETAESLRRADALLASDLTRARDAASAEIAGVRAEMARETQDMEERHLGALARLAQVEAALNGASVETEDLRNSIAIRMAALTNSTRDSLTQAESAWNERFDGLAARVRNTDQNVEEARHALAADTERVEACTMAALEKLNADRLAGDAAIAHDLDGVFTATRASIADVRSSLETETAALRRQNASLQARLDVVDTALTAITPLQIAVGEIPGLKKAAAELSDLQEIAAEIPALKAATAALPVLQAALARVEGAQHNRSFEMDMLSRVADLERRAQALAGDNTSQLLRTQIEALAAKLSAQADAPAAIAALRSQIAAQSSALASQGQRLAAHETRIGAQESAVTESADNLHNVARMLGRVSTQTAETETLAQERLHKLEVGFADLRLNQLSAADHADKASIETVSIINARIQDMEERASSALDELHKQIMHFVAENDRRISLLEHAPPPPLPQAPFAHIEQRLDELELRDFGAEFIELRRRIDDRILGLEQRSITALERVCDSVAMIEQRLTQQDEDMRDMRSA